MLKRYLDLKCINLRFFHKPLFFAFFTCEIVSYFRRKDILIKNLKDMKNIWFQLYEERKYIFKVYFHLFGIVFRWSGDYSPASNNIVETNKSFTPARKSATSLLLQTKDSQKYVPRLNSPRPRRELHAKKRREMLSLDHFGGLFWARHAKIVLHFYWL